jgi:hypothetical protein
MKNALRLARAFGGACGLVLLGALAHAALVLPGVQGPYLGDFQTNLYTIVQAIQLDNGRNSHVGLSVSQTSAQANCTQLDLSGLQEVKTSAGTGYVCLPTAVAGKVVRIGNASGQTIDLYSSAQSFVAGTADTINGTAGTTAYTGLTSGKTALCAAIANGAWYCGSIS